MIILDTNVLSALMTDRPEAIVVDWLNRQPHLSVWTTSVTVFEIRSGLQLMPQGRRRTQKSEAFELVLKDVIERRVAVFDSEAAELAADVFGACQERGRPAELRDTMIAGIVLASHATLATRNMKHFEDIAKSVVNPWKA